MGETPLEQPAVIAMTRARTYTVQDVPPEHEAERPEVIGLDPNALRRSPAPYERLMRNVIKENTARSRPNGDALTMPFAGGTVEISGEAMAQNLAMTDDDGASVPDAAAGAAPNETQESDTGESETDSSPNGDNVAPDLGERVL